MQQQVVHHHAHSGTEPFRSENNVNSLSKSGSTSHMDDIQQSTDDLRSDRAALANQADSSHGRSSRPSRNLTEEQLRLQVRFFFMNPIEKWLARRRFPWKLFLQVLKIVLVTIQGWDQTRDVRVYPPSSSPYAVFTYNDFYLKLTFAVQKYFSVESLAIGSYDYVYPNNDDLLPPRPVELCFQQYRIGKTFAYNSTYIYDTTEETVCLNVTRSDVRLNDTFMRDFLNDRNATVDFDRLNILSVNIYLKSVHLRNLVPFDSPDCLLFKIIISFDNSPHNGQVLVALSANVEYVKECNGHIYYQSVANTSKIMLGLLDAVVLFICTSSFFLCARAFYNASQLWNRTKNFFASTLQKELSWDDSLAFVNFWYIIIMLNDVCIIMGTLFKLSIEYTIFDSNLFTATGILLGVGDLLVWVGVLRYLGFFSRYNVLVLTLKRALPNILRFMICAALLYFGFLFCGWVVFSPYHWKFRTLMASSECLFSLINGDDMFATFSTMADTNQAAWWFSRIYLYTFVSLFIYVVLSLFISIIMDAYEVIKDHYDQSTEESELRNFINQCTDTPRSGNFRKPSADNLGSRMRNWWRRAVLSRRLPNTDDGYEEFN